MAAVYRLRPKGLEETVMFKCDEETFESLFDKLVSFASVKHSLRLEVKPFALERRCTLLLRRRFCQKGYTGVCTVIVLHMSPKTTYHLP